MTLKISHVLYAGFINEILYFSSAATSMTEISNYLAKVLFVLLRRGSSDVFEFF